MAAMSPVPDLSLALFARLTAALPLPEAAAMSGKETRPPDSAALPGQVSSAVAGMQPSPARVAALQIPMAATTPGQQSRQPDVVVFSSAPLRVLSDLASAGLRQLAALLPVLEQAVHAESAAPLGFLAKAVATAARQIDDGHTALLAEGPDRVAAAMRGDVPARVGSPANTATDTKELLRTVARQIGAEAEPAHDGQTSETLRTIARQIGAADRLEPRSVAEPDAGPIERWIGEAKHVLRSTGDALDRAEQQLCLLAAQPTTIVAGAPLSGWALAEIVAAQAQIAGAHARLGQARTAARFSYRAAPPTLSLDHLAGATTLLGMSLILTTLWLVGGLWSVLTGFIALGGTAVWVWRISQASRGVTLDVRG